MSLPEAPFGQLGLGQVLTRKPTRMVRYVPRQRHLGCGPPFSGSELTQLASFLSQALPRP